MSDAQTVCYSMQALTTDHPRTTQTTPPSLANTHVRTRSLRGWTRTPSPSPCCHQAGKPRPPPPPRPWASSNLMLLCSIPSARTSPALPCLPPPFPRHHHYHHRPPPPPPGPGRRPSSPPRSVPQEDLRPNQSQSNHNNNLPSGLPCPLPPPRPQALAPPNLLSKPPSNGVPS